MAPIDFLSWLVCDELTRRGDRLLERRRKQAQFRDPQKTLDNFDFNFNKKMNRSLVFDLATATFIARREDALFLGPPGAGKRDRKSTRLNSSHGYISYAVFCLKKKNKNYQSLPTLT